jgi:hypothetical protein
VAVNHGPTHLGWALGKDRLAKYKIHASETSWVGTDFDALIDNNGSLDDLYRQIKNLAQDPLLSK